ncbi:hypothetical protein OB2597_19251 [Pseudooceanicola batsensis HTCC2597]|uniref:DAGKc domain-containing protein n=1 Tax=Pseudooceanicola batsensis (strain ATCC BAA-863 / DSM 15984 / KCTC 12145 / HTCC2597) TaxID=252305 RepID=A3U0G0_PSEBH|nr:hypothetical protein [Pseudooceanicola batsensis]EAQ02251.1 hypothetical protein OB2597_19251 [Pseudooceanicola batsensis HTCC2597]
MTVDTRRPALRNARTALVIHDEAAGGIPAGELATGANFLGLHIETKRAEEDIGDQDGHGDFDLVIVAGGEDLFHETAGRWLGRDKPLLFVPADPDCATARFLSLPRRVEDMFESLATWPGVTIRPGRIRGAGGETTFWRSAGLGALAQVMQDAKPDAVAALADTVAAIPAGDARLRVDGDRVEGRWLMLECLVQPEPLPQLPLVPEAMPGDALLHLFALPEDSREAMIDWMLAPDGLPPGRMIAGREVEVEGWSGPCHADLAPLRMDSSGRFAAGLSPETVIVLAPVPRPRNLSG